MSVKVMAIVGPTGVGKTKLSVHLAKAFNGEIINGDAMQVYRGLNIGTAKITSEEMQGVPHHLIDICDPDEDYTAADFQRDARLKIKEISAKDKLPILVGGTGFYVKSALYDYQFSTAGSNPTFRSEMEELARRNGAEQLHKRLRAVDPAAAERIHPHNLVRVIRALEVYETTGVPFSQQQPGIPSSPLYNIVFIGLSMERSILYRRINDRVTQMMRDGLLKEARMLYELGISDAQSAQAIGYKEFFPYFNGNISLDQAVEQLKKNTRHYAKRQYTWFRRQMPVHWFDMTDGIKDVNRKFKEIVGYINAFHW